MRRGSAVLWAVVGMAVGVVLLVVVAADQDRGGPAVAEAEASVDADAYAATISSLCGDGVARAEAKGYDESSGAGAEAMDDIAAALAAVPPPEGRDEMAQALVDGVADYADLFRARDDNQEAFSQRQNAVTVVIEVRAAGLGADCGEGDIVLVPSVPPPPEDVAAETDPAVVDLATACHDGALVACDDLFDTDTDSALRFYGGTCGARLYYEEADFTYSCVETFAGERPTGDQP